MDISQIDAAYIAGLFDGEGCIYITYQHVKPTHSPRSNLTLEITNTHLGVLEHVKRLCGGSVRRQECRVPRLKLNGSLRKPAWNWSIASGRAASILRVLLPYLIIKHEQAKVGIAFTELVASRDKTRAVVSLEDRELRLALRDKLAALKRS